MEVRNHNRNDPIDGRRRAFPGRGVDAIMLIWSGPVRASAPADRVGMLVWHHEQDGFLAKRLAGNRIEVVSLAVREAFRFSERSRIGARAFSLTTTYLVF